MARSLRIIREGNELFLKETGSSKQFSLHFTNSTSHFLMYCMMKRNWNAWRCGDNHICTYIVFTDIFLRANHPLHDDELQFLSPAPSRTEKKGEKDCQMNVGNKSQFFICYAPSYLKKNLSSRIITLFLFSRDLLTTPALKSCFTVFVACIHLLLLTN